MKQRHFNQNPGLSELGEFRGPNFLSPPTRRKSCPKNSPSSHTTPGSDPRHDSGETGQ